MAQWYRAQVTVPHDSGIPRDAIVNTYAFRVEGSGDRDLIAADIDSRLTQFYDSFAAGLSSQYTWAAATVKVIDMTDELPRFPFYEATLTITEPATTQYDWPAEVAVCLSFQGERTSGVNMRRRRGRVYLGPFQVGTGDMQMVPSGLISPLVTAADDYLLTPTAPLGLSEWAIYSRYTHFGVPVGTKLDPDVHEEIPDALPASFVPVERCWIDNAWDIQRRRGPAATSRTTVVKP